MLICEDQKTGLALGKLDLTLASDAMLGSEQYQQCCWSVGERHEVHRRGQFSAGAVHHLCPSGHGREKVGDVLGAINPEVMYFTDNGVGRAP